MGSAARHRGVRMLLLAAIVVVSLLSAYSFVSRHIKRGAPQSLPPKIAAGVDQQTQTFSLSKSSGDQRLYTVSAARVTNFKDTGKTVLHDVTVELFGKQGDRHDRITSENCEFSTATGILFFPSEVRMEFRSPDGSEPVDIITSGLTFNQNSGVASTEMEVRFQFERGQGSSQGAHYDPQTETVTLSKNARVTVRARNAETSGATDFQNTSVRPIHISASNLRYSRTENKIDLAGPVTIRDGTQQLIAGGAEVLLDKNQEAREAHLSGGVHGADSNTAAPAELLAARADLQFQQGGRPRTVLLSGDAAPVLWAAASERSFKSGEARSIELVFDGTTGQLARVNSTGDVRLVLNPFNPVLTLPLLRPAASAPLPQAGARVMLAQNAQMNLAGDGRTVRTVTTRSSSVIQMLPKAAEEHRTIQADDFGMKFDDAGELIEFKADGKVRYTAVSSSPPPKGGTRVSTSEYLLATFEPAEHAVTRIIQWGGFRYSDPQRQARAERADYAVERDAVLLEGGEPTVWNDEAKLSANRISLANATGAFTAEGNVSSTDFPKAASSRAAPQPIHAVADHMDYNSNTQIAVYKGNARLWQGNSIIESPELVLNRTNSTLEARGGVYSVFETGDIQPGPTSSANGKLLPDRAGKVSGTQAQPAGPIVIRAKSLTYRQDERLARYEGEVRLQNADATLVSNDLQIEFQGPSGTGPVLPSQDGRWEVRKITARGNVSVTQPGRKGTGEVAEYVPGDEKIELTGNLATISDAGKGQTQGTRLTYLIRDDRIQVRGEPGLPAQTRRQVQR